MAKKWSPKLMSLPNGQVIRIGANGHVSPQVPCGQCGRPIRYYKGDMEKWPWYCSPECAAGEPVHKRCAACYGAMRRPVRLDKDHYVCKSCSLRMAHLFRKMGDMDAHFLDYFVNHFIKDILAGTLEVSFVRVTNGLWEYVPRAATLKKAAEKKEPKKKDPTDRTAKDYDPWDDPSRDYEIDLKIKQGFLNEEGVVIDQKSGLLGQKWRDVYPLKRM